MPLINFILKPPDKVDPSGKPPNLSLSWFYLTDGELWLTFADATLYEYSAQILRQWANRPNKFSDYYIVRFIEDFAELFPAIARTISNSLYNVVKTYSALQTFEGKVQEWIDEWPDQESPESKSNEDRYGFLTTWKNARILTSGHLKGGPRIGFFRCGKKISIVWNADRYDENDLPYWTAGNGEIELDYDAFVAEIEDFGDRFFSAMATQVQLAADREWGAIKLDKQRMAAEQQERKSAFGLSIAALKNAPTLHEDWEGIGRSVERLMKT